tara:strand:- start:237 stop:938 length:702 start_codon:yes stop_codon:yes gene_type:complete
MKNTFNKIITRTKDLMDFRFTRKSFSQFGEDLIMESALNIIKEKNITYLDVGANHPSLISNSYYFYRNGATGTLIEPDPTLYKNLKKKRPYDTVLNCGVGFSKKIETAKLYIMNNPVLNTFSFEEAKRMEEIANYKIINDLDIQMIPINFILEEMKFLPSFISIDVEGLDYKILESLDTQKYRPALIVAETLTFEPNTGGEKIDQIIELMQKKNYKVFADTRLNTIFIDENRL